MQKIIISFLCLWLSGCVGAAVTGANLAYDHRSVQSSMSNQVVQLNLSGDVKKDPLIGQPNRISITVTHYDILIVGQVPDAASKQRVSYQADAAKTNQKILNFLTVGPVIEKSVQVEDSWITTKIRTKIVTGNDINPKGVKVITENGVVYLLGAMPRNEADAVISIAKKTDGVKKVVTLLYYLDLHES